MTDDDKVDAAVDVDVLVATDLRLPGGTVASLAQEARAAVAADVRYAMLHVPSRLARGERPLAPAAVALVRDGVCELVGPVRPVRCRVLLLRHPAVFAVDDLQLPPVTADVVVVQANQAAADADGERYDAGRVDDIVTAWTGRRPVWWPVGPVVRRTLAPWQGRLQMSDEDWAPVLDPAAIAPPRSGPRGPRPVIGRHSRPQPAKWPVDPSVMRQVYPVDGSVDVRVLGGAAPAREVLGEVPERWQVEAFGARSAQQFLADVDFWVYYHSPRWEEAFGRAVLEALAAGCVVVLPPHFEPVFGDGALYREPEDVLPTVRALHADADAFRARSRAAQDAARRFLPDAHVARIRTLAGLGPEPSGLDGHDGSTAGAPRLTDPASSTRERVLFITSNGAGMGHLTRLLALAHRLGDGLDSVFLSLSSAAPVVAEVGAAWEYCPSRGAAGMTTRLWNLLFRSRFVDVMAAYDPCVVVFDGTWPYLGMVEVRDRYPDVAFVWCRRAMWKESTPPDQLAKSAYFDVVLEPGELAAPFDRGPTTRAGDAERLRPFTYLDPADLLRREEARAGLGMDPDAPALLLSLGAGNINDIDGDVALVVETMKAAHPGWQVCLPVPAITERRAARRAGVVPVSAYPLSRYYRAFDASVAASGYNAFHELVYLQVPTAFVPNLHTSTDDQDARARFAEHSGVGLYAPELGSDVEALLARLTDQDERDRMRGRSGELYPGNGAADAAARLTGLAQARHR